MYNTIVINVDELWLKGKNRPLYFKAIRKHIIDSIAAYHEAEFTCKNEEQRFVAKSGTDFSDEAIEVLLRVPGIHSIMPARRIDRVSYDAIFPVVKQELERMDNLSSFATFKVETRRSCKEFPMTSMDVSREIGGRVLEAFPELNVDVKNPELVIEIRILKKSIYVSTFKMNGVGGLPVGTSGHIVSLISGGFDSPVASYLMSKRGCRQTFIFFYAYPFVGDEVKDKILKLMEVLGQYQRNCRLYVVPFGDVQNLISKNCHPDYRTVLFRKAMIQCAGKLAKRVKAEALLTGDALGQVSSQTIGNISVVEKSSPLPVFRPLVGFNKIEIIGLAKAIGTHDISVIPHDDACSLFAPRHPVIKPDRFVVEKFDSEVSLDQELEKALTDAEIYEVSLTGKLNLIGE